MSARYYVVKQSPLQDRRISHSSLDMHTADEDGPSLPITYVHSVKKPMETYIRHPGTHSPQLSRRGHSGASNSMLGSTLQDRNPLDSGDASSGTSSSGTTDQHTVVDDLGDRVVAVVISTDKETGGAASNTSAVSNWLERCHGSGYVGADELPTGPSSSSGRGDGNDGQTSAEVVETDCETMELYAGDLLTGDSSQRWVMTMGSGNTTDRTSMSSSDWGDDICEFDRQESHKVRQMFDEIERLLFDDLSLNCTGSLTYPSSLNSPPPPPTPPLLEDTRSGRYPSGPPYHPRLSGQDIKGECQQWVGRFPHFRLHGTQLLLPQDSGFSFHPTPLPSQQSSQHTPHPPPPRTTPPKVEHSPRGVGKGGRRTPSSLTTGPGARNSMVSMADGGSPHSLGSPRSNTAQDQAGEVDCISLLGRHIDLSSSPKSSAPSNILSSDALHPVGTSPSQGEEKSAGDPLDEEVFARDGSYEETIAIDYRLPEEEASERQGQRRRLHGYPPLSPNAALRDSVASFIFDAQWTEVVSWMRPLFSESLRRVFRDTVKSSDGRSSSELPLQIEFSSAGREPNLITRPHRPLSSVNSHSGLDDLLQISPKTIQQRQKSIHDHPSPAPTPSPLGPHSSNQSQATTSPSNINQATFSASATPAPSRPGSSVVSRPTAIRSSQESRAASARRIRTTPTGKLNPLDRNLRTPDPQETGTSLAFEVAAPTPPSAITTQRINYLRGRSLQTQQHYAYSTHSYAQQQQGLMASRLDSLPPISGSLNYNMVGGGGGFLKGVRVGSAFPQYHKNRSQSVLSQSGPSDFPNRPSTSQTYRFDTSLGRRSSTPLGLRTSGMILNLGVHGNSIGNPSNGHGLIHPGQIEEPLVDTRKQSVTSNWGAYPVPNSANFPYRRGKQFTSFIR